MPVDKTSFDLTFTSKTDTTINLRFNFGGYIFGWSGEDGDRSWSDADGGGYIYPAELEKYQNNFSVGDTITAYDVTLDDFNTGCDPWSADKAD